MNRLARAWKLPFTSVIVTLVAAGLTLISLTLNSSLGGLPPDLARVTNLRWLGAAAPIVLCALVLWSNWFRPTETKARRRGQEEMGRLALVAQRTDNVVVITTRDGLIAWINDAFSRLTGHNLAAVAGKPPGAVLLGGQQSPQAIERIRDGVSHRRHFSVELPGAHKNGSRYWLALSFTPVIDELNQMASYIIIGTDITARKKAEEELARLNRRNELLLDAAGEGICALGLDGRISFVNPAAARLTGWQTAELVGQPAGTIISQLRRSKGPNSQEDPFLGAVLQDTSVTVGDSDVFQRKDGTSFPVDYTSTPVREGANPVGAVVVFRDVTDRRQTEVIRTRQTRQYALRADIAMALTAGETLDSFLHRAAQAIVKQLDGALALIWVHNPDESMLELEASAGTDIIPDPTQRRIAVGDLTAGKLAGQRIPRLTNELVNEAAPLERDWLRREKLTGFAGYPMLVEGRLVGVLGFYSQKRLPDDALESLGSVADSIAQGIMRKRAEQKVAEQAALLDKAQDAILVVDLSHRVAYWNKSAERLYGWSAKEACGKRADELLYRDTAYFERARRETMEKGEWSGELCQVNKGDEGVIVESQWTLVQDDAGKPRSILIVSTDIREKKKMEGQFLRTQRMDSIGTLAGGIAHDLNNVLSPILMSVQMLKEKFRDDQSQRMLTVLESSAKRGADMVKQVLTFARGVDGERVLLQVRHLIKEMVKIIGETFPKNIQVKTNVPDTLWTLTGDATQLHQVLLNLCVNARDAMPNGGTITLTAENIVLEEIPKLQPSLSFDAKPGSYVLVKVSDMGTGISPEVLDKIFEPFFTTKETGKGTGLGLATVLGIVKSHGGFMQVQTEVNKGTMLCVYLPASENPQSAAGDGQQKKLPTGHGELILAVDDEAAVLSMIKETLETYGYRAVTANDGAEAVAAFTAHRGEIKAIITDMIMPHMDGPSTIRVIKKLDPSARIVAASGLMDAQKVKDSTGLEHLAFLMKPFTAEKLLTTVQQVLTE
jgi:PAS domain S-box-containing protein